MDHHGSSWVIWGQKDREISIFFQWLSTGSFLWDHSDAGRHTASGDVSLHGRSPRGRPWNHGKWKSMMNVLFDGKIHLELEQTWEKSMRKSIYHFNKHGKNQWENKSTTMFLMGKIQETQ